MLVPEAWDNDPQMSSARKAFYEFHACLVEPWDGPAGIAFTDGIQIGGILDRNGLRPARYLITDDDIVTLASETGVLDIDASRVVQKGRLQPGKIFLIDTAQGRIITDDEKAGDLRELHAVGVLHGLAPNLIGRQGRNAR